MAESIAFEVGDAWNMGGKVLLAGVASGLNDMLWVYCASFGCAIFFLPLENDCPLALRFIPV
jgi:hypothetical protein